MRNLAHKTLAAVVVAITLCTGLFVSGFGVSTAQAQSVFNASLDPKRPVIDKSGALDNLASGLKNELTQQLARANSLHAKGASSGKEYSIFMVVVNGTDSLTPQQWGKEFLSHNHAPTPSVVLVAVLSVMTKHSSQTKAQTYYMCKTTPISVTALTLNSLYGSM